MVIYKHFVSVPFEEIWSQKLKIAAKNAPPPGKILKDEKQERYCKIKIMEQAINIMVQLI